MPTITQPKTREIVEDFAAEIKKRAVKTARPSRTVINFRNERADNFEREIVQVPIDLLRFRKDNGRIASDLLDYEHTGGPLNESDDRAQAKLREFLRGKDPEKTNVLRKNIIHAGQQEPAIITCDGFLINGNRRKMVMDDLHKHSPQEEKYQFMKVVILPGFGDEGGPPTLLEMEKLENRYQLQSEGKSEYYGFDRALSIKRKIDIGLTLKEQLRDDPQYAEASDKQIDQAIKVTEKDYLQPLKCVDRYLKQFQRERQYHTVSTGVADREGRWQAFKDYSNTYHSKFQNQNYLLDSGIEEEDVGEIEEAAFDIIRLRSVPDMPKVHLIMRNLHKYCSSKEGLKEILGIPKKVEATLPVEECFEDEDMEKPLAREVVDQKWAAQFKRPITFHLKRAAKLYESHKEKETPIELLEAAYKKLTHTDMDLSNIKTNDYSKAHDLARDIQNEANNIEKQIYEQQKKFKKKLPTHRKK